LGWWGRGGGKLYFGAMEKGWEREIKRKKLYFLDKILLIQISTKISITAGKKF